jgi:hypothetical protein
VTKSLRHKFNQAIADGADATLVRPSNWNDDHNLWLGIRAVTITSDAITNADHLTLVRYKNAGATAVSLPAPSGGNMPLGWMATLQNVFSPAVTLTGSGCTINGAASLVLAQGDALQLYSDGTSDYAAIVNKAPVAPVSPGMIWLQTQDGSGLGSISFNVDSTYDEYEIHFQNVGASGGPSIFQALYYCGGIWLTSGYYWAITTANANLGSGVPAQAVTSYGSGNNSVIILWPTDGVPTPSNPARGLNGIVRISAPAATNNYKTLNWSIGGIDDAGISNLITATGSGANSSSTSAVTTLALALNTGTFRSGSIARLYGVKK